MAYELIKQAIIEKKQVIATYRGLQREMSPHVLGHKGLRPQALFYQFGGESSSGLKPRPPAQLALHVHRRAEQHHAPRRRVLHRAESHLAADVRRCYRCSGAVLATVGSCVFIH